MTEQEAAQSGTQANRWGLLAMLGLTAILLAAFGRVAQLQVAPGEELQAFIGERLSQRSEKSWRGDLLDRRGRPIALSRVGRRAFIDPMRLAELEVDEISLAIHGLAEALERPESEVRERVRERLAASDERVREGKGPLRFAAVGEMLSDEQAQAVAALNIRGVHLEQRDIRETVVSDALSRLVGLVGFEHEGRLGAELELDSALRSEDGSLRYLRDAQGRPLWVERGHWAPGSDGRDISLSIDLELQRIAEEELWRGIYDADAVGGRLVMLDPRTGEVLAMTDLVRDVEGLQEYPWTAADAPRVPLEAPGPNGSRYVTLPPDEFRDKHPATSRNRCVQDMYEPGSTFKPFVWAAVTQAGLVNPAEVFNTHNGFWLTSYGRSIEDVTRRPKMAWSEVLVNSSNIGMIQGAERIEPEELRAMLSLFGFGEPTGIRLPGEMAGIMTPLSRWSHWTQTSVAFGHEVAVTPIQMARAFCCFARSGDAAGTLPELSLVALAEGEPLLDVLQPVVRPDVAMKVREVLLHVATKMEKNVMERKNPEDSGWRYRIFGKSGTAEIPTGPPPEGMRRPAGSRGYFEEQYNSSFIAGGPFEDPRVVVLVVIDDPGPEHVFQPPLRRTHYGSHVAGPVVRRVIERSLDYLGVPASDPELEIEYEKVNDW